jgi:hypothetical protein
MSYGRKKAAPRNFVTVPVSLWTSPGIRRLRARLQYPIAAEAYFVRAIWFGKDHEKTGQMAARWEDLAAFVEWPGTADSMRNAFRDCGLVFGDADELWEWENYMGRHLEAYAADARRHADERAEAKAQGATEQRLKAERADRRAKVSRKVTQSSRVGTVGTVGTVARTVLGQSLDGLRTVLGRKDGKGNHE